MIHSSISGDKTKLGPAEKFFLSLIDLKSYQFRISTLILKEDFDATAEALKPNISVVKQAIQDILNNDTLPDILR